MEKASADQRLEYNDILFRKLNDLKLPDSLAHCQDVNCQNVNHRKTVDEHCLNILESICESGHSTLPQYNPENNASKHFKK